MMASSRKGRGPTDEELHLWQQVTQHDKKLPPRREKVVVHKPKPAPARVKKAEMPPVKVQKTALSPLERGSYADMDASTARKLKRGSYPIDRKLDLHGMRRDEAYAALERSLAQAYRTGQRCLLVITGKGRSRGQSEEQGVLRGLFAQWMNDEKLRPFVLAFDAATAAHGGQGAFYVLVRRRREKR